MSTPRRPSPQTIAVLVALARQSGTWRYGYELCTQLDIKAGSMYPILMRLAERGLLDTTWEDGAPAGRPPRHLYRLSDAGLEYTAALADAALARAADRSRTRLRTRPA